MSQRTSNPWMGGLWGREGVHPGQRSWSGTFGLHRSVFSGSEYRRRAVKSQENTLRNRSNILFIHKIISYTFSTFILPGLLTLLPPAHAWPQIVMDSARLRSTIERGIRVPEHDPPGTAGFCLKHSAVRPYNRQGLDGSMQIGWGSERTEGWTRSVRLQACRRGAFTYPYRGQRDDFTRRVRKRARSSGNDATPNFHGGLHTYAGKTLI